MLISKPCSMIHEMGNKEEVFAAIGIAEKDNKDALRWFSKLIFPTQYTTVNITIQLILGYVIWVMRLF